MNLNSNERLSSLPSVDIERSRFNSPMRHITTANAGDIVPFLCRDLIPGTTVNFDTSFVARMLTPIAPVMDDAYIDFDYFFVPYRLLWEHWREFNGENTSSYWAQPQTYHVPMVNSGSGWTNGSLADHLGFPVGVPDIEVSCFPFRAYCMIYNEWWRNQNVSSPSYFNKTDVGGTYSLGSETYLGGDLLQSCRMHDYFSDCLPQPQKGDASPLFPGIGNAEVIYGLPHDVGLHDACHFVRTEDGLSPDINRTLGISAGGSMSYGTGTATFPATNGVAIDNLYADQSFLASYNINQLRLAFATQRYLERLAYGGSRYAETLNTFFGLSPQDARLQRPEFLGSARFTINMSPVLQTSSTDSVTPQGNASGYSATSSTGGHISYSTQEHGLLMGVFTIRHARSYQQKIPRAWSRKDLLDFYNPCFAHIGAQAVLNKEISTVGTSVDDNVFGYAEAWADYRYGDSTISGEMRSDYAQSLDIWHYGDDYGGDTPVLSDSWMREGKEEIARTLAVQDGDQFLVQIYNNIDTVAPLPLYSVPGLIDHF